MIEQSDEHLTQFLDEHFGIDTLDEAIGMIVDLVNGTFDAETFKREYDEFKEYNGYK